MIPIKLLIPLLLYLFLFQPWLIKRRYKTGYALFLLGFNPTALCLYVLLFPFYGTFAGVCIGCVLLGVNLAFDLMPGQWIKKSGMLDFRPGKPIKAVILLPMAVIIPFGTLEWTAQKLVMRGVLEHDTPMKTVWKKGTNDWRMAHITADEYRLPDPVLFWRPRFVPPYTSQGFKGPEVDVPKPQGVFRVICYGDSNTEGPPKAVPWPSRLQGVLDKETVSGSGPLKYEVLNAGCAGYSSYQGLKRFQQEVETYTPDLVLVSFGWNDIAFAMGRPDNSFEAPPGAIVFLQRLLLNFKFYLCLKHYLSERGAVQSDTTVSSVHRVSVEEYTDNLNGFVETGRKHGTRVVILTRPHRMSVEEMLKAPLWRCRVPEYNEAIRAFAGKNSVFVIDVQEYFESHHPDLFSDGCHFLEQGHMEMAKMLRRELTRLGCLSLPPDF